MQDDSEEKLPEIIEENKMVETKETLDIRREKSPKKIKIILLVIAIIFSIIIVFFLVIACINKFNTNVYKNVYLIDKDMSNMSHEEVINFLNEEYASYTKNSEIDVYQNDDNIYTIKSDDVDSKINISKTAENILSFGRTGNIIKDNLVVLKALFIPKKFQPIYEYNENSLQDVIKNIDLTLNDRYVDDTYSVDNKTNKLIIVKGKTGNTIDYNQTENDIIELLKNNKKQDYKLTLTTQKPKSINVDDVYNNVKKDAKDAYIDKSVTPNKFVNEEVGLDFDKDKLNEVLNESENLVEGKTIEFDLKITQPSLKLTDITYTLYNDKLSGYTTYFDPRQLARGNNMEIALKYLNGVIVMPSETFSYNAIIGDTTVEKGYLPAATFKGGIVVQEYGGGICQTVSTLYDAALIANLQIVERHQHGLPVGYVKPSLDATVYGNVLDLKFKNTRNYPIKIVTSYSKTGSMNISIYGTKEENEYDITLSSKYLYTTPYTTVYTYDSDLSISTQQVISNGVNGYASEGYITKKLNGVVISTDLLSKDVYKPEQEVVKIGTKDDNAS